jgi:hypothetical protein
VQLEAPAALLKLPALQGSQVALLEAPTALLAVPAGHSAQAPAALKLPALQG